MVKKKSLSDIDSEIRGSALRVYTSLYLHPDNCAGPREVSRALGFKSPSSALFQLEKLREKGLVAKHRSGEYCLSRIVKIGILRNYIRIQHSLVPRTFFYALLVSFVTITLTVFFIRYGSLETLLIIIPSLIAGLALWFETYQIWKLRPQIAPQQNFAENS